MSERRLEFVNELKNNSNLISLLSVNENEYLQIINIVLKMEGAENILNDGNCINQITPFILCKSASFLSNFFKINICIHTMIGSVLSDGFNTVFVESISPSRINIVSGAEMHGIPHLYLVIC